MPNAPAEVTNAEAMPLAPGHTGLLNLLGRHPREICYALVDAARDPSIFQMLQSLPLELCRSLYEGETDLTAFAPHLVVMDDLTRSQLLSLWGRDCMVFTWARQELSEVRLHFRRFLMVHANGQQLYFRFYDPRVLRRFLPSCTVTERTEFFGLLRGFLAEETGGTSAMVFERDGTGAFHSERTSLS